MEEHKNLITKATERLKELTAPVRAYIYKKVAPLVLAVLIVATSFFGLTACDSTTPSDVSITCPACGGNHSSDYHNNQNDYSALLHSVEQDPYYQSIVANAYEPSSDYVNGEKVKKDYYYKLNQHPYGFLADQGYDVEAIRNGNLSCQTFSFVRDDAPTKLYIGTRVQTEDQTDGKYYTNYLISYNLTKQEMQDYIDAYNQRYVYANFLNDAISKQKKVTIHNVSYSKMDVTNELFEYAKKTGTLKIYEPFKNIVELFYVSGVAGNTGENEMTIIGFTPTEAHYISLEDGRYVDVRRDILYRLGNAAAEAPTTEAQVYGIKYFNRTWIGYEDNFYDHRDDYCCGFKTFNPSLEQ